MILTRKFVIRAFAALALARAAGAQTAPTVVISPVPKLQFFDNNGKPMSGGCVATYAGGTTTPLATYTDATGSVPNANPVVLDASGRAAIWIKVDAIKYVVKQKSGATCSMSSGTVLTTTDNVQDAGLRLRTDLATPGANVPDAGLELRTDLAAPTGAGLMGYSQTTTYAAGTVGQRLERVINVADAPYNAKADGTGTAGTDQSAAFQQAINDLNTRGGGGLFIPWAPKCYQAHGVQLYSNITVYSDSRATCLQQPANGWTTQGQVLTTGNGGAGGAAVSNIHIDNLTIDGNKANQSGVPANQDGGYGVLLAGCSNCSITDSIIKNNITDGIVLEGSGSTTLTMTANAIEATCTITGATYSGNVGTYTCSSPHGMTPIAYVTVSGMTPAGYNQTAAQCVFLTAATFGCHIASNPGAFATGGTATWSKLQYVSGEPISNMQQTVNLTGGAAGGCVALSVNQALNSLSCTTDQGTNANVVYTIPVVATGVGDNVEISGNLITGNERNGISQLCGTHTSIHDNHISYTSGILSGPWSGIDLEPDKYGCIFAGSTWVNNELDHNQGSGFTGQPLVTYDPNFSPVFQNINAHDNGFGAGASPQAAGLLVGGPFGPDSALTISGVFQNNGASTSNGGSGVIFGWQNSSQVTFPWIVTAGSWNGIQSGSIMGSAQILGGSLSATGNDVGFSQYSGYLATPFVVNGASMTGAGAGSFLADMAFPLYGIPSQAQAFSPNGLCYWPVSSPRTGKLNCATYVTAGDYSMFPFLQASDGTVTALMQAVSGIGAAFLNQGTQPVWMGSANASYGAVGSFAINRHGLSLQPADTFANVTSGSTCANATQGYEANIIDGSTAVWGATVAGGGSAHVKIRCNGSNWTVEGN